MDPLTILILAGLGAGVFFLSKRIEAGEPPPSDETTTTPPMLPPSLGGIPGVADAEMFGRLLMQVDWEDVGDSVKRSFDTLFNPSAIPSVQEQVNDKRAAWGEAVTDIVLNHLPNEVFDDFSSLDILTAITQRVAYPEAIDIFTAVRTFREDPRMLFTMTEPEARDIATRIFAADPSIGANTMWAADLRDAFGRRMFESRRAFAQRESAA